MRKILFHLLLLVMILTGCTPKEAKAPKSQIISGKIDSLYSATLKEQRKIFVYVPEGAEATQAKYPVLYLLDGDAHYFSVAGMIQQLSTINGNTICPEMIVVAIPNTDRTRDLTPTHVAKMFGDTTFSKTSGGGEQFTEFISKELIPYVDKNYPTTSHRTLVGHSFGGLFVINTIVHHPEIFNYYISIDPSLWWDKQKLLKESEILLAETKSAGKTLFVGVANTMKKGMKVSDLEGDTTEATEHIRSIFQFVKSVDKMKDNGLRFSWKYYDQDSHGSVPLITEYDGLHFLFSWYPLEGMGEFYDSKSTRTPDELIAILESHYKDVSEHFGYTVLPPELMVNGLAYELMFSKKNEAALALFKLNTVNYPQSANVHDSMGDYFLAQKDTVQAVASFTKAMSIKQNPSTKEKLDKLKNIK